jgi:peptide/nickel transport system substrate-binding protein
VTLPASKSSGPGTRSRLLAWLLACALIGLALTGCGQKEVAREPGVLTVSVQRARTWERNFNPLSPHTTPCWPTIAGVHEPLLVFNSVKSEYVPWLAVSHQWLDGNLTLRVNLREGVRWSDGKPFSATDVVFTFQTLRDHPATDQHGIWEKLAAVKEIDPQTVDFVFQRVFVPGFDDVSVQPIVPAHIWREVADPLTFANEDPVGTGPFTEIRLFEDQVYEVGRNKHYWQEGKPAVEALRFPALPGNDESNMGLIYGEIDWAGDFIPAIERVFVERDPEHHHFWSPLTGGGIFLYANMTHPRFQDVRVRKAISLAINRQLLVDVAMFRYTRPADATGLTDSYAAWRDSSAIRQGRWVDFDPDQAQALLDQAGLPRGSDGVRRDAVGTPLEYELLCVEGWTDWQRAVEIIAEGLGEVGIKVEIMALDFGTWFQRLSKGEFELGIGWSVEGASPYHIYRGLMSSRTCESIGTLAASNWHRYASPRADAILDRFEATSDPGEMALLAGQLQHLFVEEAPAIPLFPGPSWAAYSTHHFRGFPSPEDPYADPSPNKFARGEVLLVLTNLRPAAR